MPEQNEHDFSMIERRIQEPPDEPHPRYTTCPICGSDDVVEATVTPMHDDATGGEGFRCQTCEHEWPGQ